ncbi:LacI family DNA-binding transcriptional regulator [Kribbella shirazensis]|uniref:DNA-binding LacI/PurR family transcriptional regulator n=1 Tax=Kribbella shirazensis TaxID=1105143 RepID=A0A7X5VGP5_9ACTN|nr:LacI family DNA-binding transcriptional regulator [Kribbella shirazensis]NIK59798.1 DNA-binding LacI/PurR family transcriptional regulator [Kribbella shirazensis]
MSVQRRPTMYDVAALAGVSHQTVSRYLRADPTVKVATSTKIKAAIDELGYRPNLTARAMRTRRTGVVAIILPGWTGPERTVEAACAEAQRLGYQVEIVIGVDEDPAALSRLADDILGRGQVDGVLSVTPLTVTASGVVVQTDEFDDRLRAVEAVAADEATMEEIVEKLAALGHREFFHVAGPQDWRSAQLRRSGYLKACERLGLRSHGVYDGPWHPDTGVAAVQSLPDDTPVTAVVAASDHIGVGVLRAAFDRGWRVPDDLSVTGWDDLTLVRYGTPALSTVRLDRETSGRHGMRRLVAALRNEPEPEPLRAAPTEIVFRETTAPPR